MILILILTVLIFIMNVACFFIYYSNIDEDNEDVRYVVLLVLTIFILIMSFVSAIAIFQELKPPEQKFLDCMQHTDTQELHEYCKAKYLN